MGTRREYESFMFPFQMKREKEDKVSNIDKAN